VNGHIVLTSIFLLLAGRSWAEEPATNPPQPALGAQLPYTEVLTPPLPVNGVQMPFALLSESSRSNFIRGDIQLGSGYDDNALVTPNNHVSNVSFLVLPRIEVRQNRERLSLDFVYSPGLTINQHLSERNQTAQSLDFTMNYRLSPHVGLQLRDNFAMTNNLFSGLFGNTPGPGPLQQSNSSVITPLADSTSNNSGLGLTYQFRASSLVGVSGNYYFVNYGSVAGANGGSGLIDSRSGSAAGFYAHRFSNRHWVGVTYNFQQLMFYPGGRTTIPRALGFYSIPRAYHLLLPPGRDRNIPPAS